MFFTGKKLPWPVSRTCGATNTEIINMFVTMLLFYNHPIYSNMNLAQGEIQQILSSVTSDRLLAARLHACSRPG
jgi:hypothetical protein